MTERDDPGQRPVPHLHLPPRLRLIEIHHLPPRSQDAKIMADCHVEPWYPHGPPAEHIAPVTVTAILVHHIPTGLLLGIPAQATSDKTIALAMTMLKAGMETIQ